MAYKFFRWSATNLLKNIKAHVENDNISCAKSEKFFGSNYIRYGDENNSIFYKANVRKKY